MIFLRKTIILVFLAFLILVLVQDKSSKMIIPDEAIRIRIIANSKDEVDIEEKIQVKEALEKEIYQLLSKANSVSEARTIINNNMDTLKIVIDDATDYNYKISFGKNHFPSKTYRGIVYDEGDYESLVVTLGHGIGDNWWCVLFPPLCNIEANENTKDVEYQFLVKKIIDKYF